MVSVKHHRSEHCALLESRLRYHLRCLREDAADPEMSALERVALVRDRATRIREIRRILAASHEDAAVALSPKCPMEANRRRD
jgi:hypothetical protein